MVDPNGIDFDKLERYRVGLKYRRDIVTGTLENPYEFDPDYPLGEISGTVKQTDEGFRCKKYGYHRTFENSVLCPVCLSELY